MTADQIVLDEDSPDIPIEIFWNKTKKRDKFTLLILKLLKDEAEYHKDIALGKYEN